MSTGKPMGLLSQQCLASKLWAASSLQHNKVTVTYNVFSISTQLLYLQAVYEGPWISSFTIRLKTDTRLRWLLQLETPESSLVRVRLTFATSIFKFSGDLEEEDRNSEDDWEWIEAFSVVTRLSLSLLTWAKSCESYGLANTLSWHRPRTGPAAQLQASLGLDGDRAAYLIFAASIRDLCLSKLDLTVQPSHLSFRMLEPIFEQAKDDYPNLLRDLDDNDSDIKSALKEYIVMQHKVHRCCLSRVNEILPPENISSKQKVSVKKCEEVLVSGLRNSSKAIKDVRNRETSPDELTPTMNSARRVYRNGRWISSAEWKGKQKEVTFSKQDSMRDTYNRSCSIISLSDDEKIPDIKPVICSSNGTTIKAQGPIDMSALEDFLQAATPSMGKFLSHFLDAGLQNEDDLKAIAEWDEKEIIDFFLTSTRQFEVKMTTIDIFRLKKHLKAYFLGK
ncbi:hypothetical protein BJ165DRAFT_1408950 [Panaeolus papilionaceus]|nr:hypothetical protein BJ165DRAFT_1408950 [Panaeolus papilionaceus]